MSAFAGSDIAQHIAQHAPDLTLIGKVQELKLAPFDDVYLLRDPTGNIHTFARLISEPPTKQSFGQFNDLTVAALVELERWANKNGYLFDSHRVTQYVGPHRTSDPMYDSAHGDIPAIVVSAVWKANQDPNKGPVAPEAKAPGTVEPYQHQPEGFEAIINKHKEVTAKLRIPHLSSKGWGISNIPFLAPAFVPGRAHDPNATTWKNLAEMVLTHFADFYTKYPKLRPFSRQSLQKGVMKGVGDKTPQEIQEFALSTPIRTYDYATMMQLTRERGARVQGNKLRPLEERKIKPIEYRSANAKKIHQLDKEYLPARKGACNRHTGKGVARLVVRGEAIGPFGEKVALSEQELVQRACEEIVNWLEEFGADNFALGPKPEGMSNDAWLEKLKEEWKESADYQRVPSTFTFMFLKRVIDYSGLGNDADTNEVTDIVINIPFTEYSNARMKERITGPKGEVVPIHTTDDGYQVYGTVNSKDTAYALRNLYNGPPGEGCSGVEGFGGKIPSHEGPIGLDIDPWMREFQLCLKYANDMGPDFISTSYANDGAQANIQSLGVENQGLARSLIFHTGVFVKHLRYKLGMSGGIRTPDVFKGFVEKRVSNDGGTPVKRKKGFGKQEKPFELVRNPVTKKLPEYDSDSPFGEMISYLAIDVGESGKPVWIDPNNKEAGYCVIDQFAGLDLEVPMHGYLQFFNARIANALDDLQKDLPEGKIAVIHQTDLIRTWDEFFKFLRNLKEVRNKYSEELSKLLLESINDERRKKGKSLLQDPPELQFDLSGQEVVALLQQGAKAVDKNGNNLVNRIFNQATATLKAQGPAIYGFEKSDFASLGLQKSVFETVVQDYLPGGKRHTSFIKDTLETAITFRFCMICRFRVEDIKKYIKDYQGGSNATSSSDLNSISIPSAANLVETEKDEMIAVAIRNNDQGFLQGHLEHVMGAKKEQISQETALLVRETLFEKILNTPANNGLSTLEEYKNRLLSDNSIPMLHEFLESLFPADPELIRERLAALKSTYDKSYENKDKQDAKIALQEGLLGLLHHAELGMTFPQALKAMKEAFYVAEGVYETKKDDREQLNIDLSAAPGAFYLSVEGFFRQRLRHEMIGDLVESISKVNGIAAEHTDVRQVYAVAGALAKLIANGRIV